MHQTESAVETEKMWTFEDTYIASTNILQWFSARVYYAFEHDRLLQSFPHKLAYISTEYYSIHHIFLNRFSKNVLWDLYIVTPILL